MKNIKIYIAILIACFLLILENKVHACSMYKVTVKGKTMVGCNEDAWRTTSRIWFENAKHPNEYGAGFTGSRQVASFKTAPQSGMNEKGLTFSRLVAFYPKQNDPFPNRLKITNEVDYLTDILHKCATVEEVKEYIEKYDHSLFFDDVYIYIDSSGRYLIVEPYNLIVGNDPYYVLSNFCPSITDNDRARNLERYRNGEDFLKIHKTDTSLSYCTALSDTMHVCRNRNGDGTLLTSIWNTKDRLVNLYFYHSYDSTIQFNLTEELAKGDRIINIPELFEKNLEYERLVNYKTPYNTPVIRILLAVLGGVLTFFAMIFGISLIRNKKGKISASHVSLIAGINVLLTGYLFVLATNEYIYYFDAPYRHYGSNLISAASYMPFLLLIMIVPFTLFTIKMLKTDITKRWLKTILVSNNLIYLMLIVSFAYWGLYHVWN